MSIHTMGGVNYHTRRVRRQLGEIDLFPMWEARWELPTRNGGPTEIQMVGEWVGFENNEMAALRLAREDFVGCPAEPESINTEMVNDR